MNATVAVAAVFFLPVSSGLQTASSGCLLFTGMGASRWTKALGDLQGLGCSLSRPNMEALFRSAVHAPVSEIESVNSVIEGCHPIYSLSAATLRIMWLGI